MSFKYTFLACLILAAYEVASAVDDAKLDVTVFYETLDDRSVKFFTNNFQANFSNLLNFIDVELVPFGKAEIQKTNSGEHIVVCDHKDVECLGNRVHACAIKNIPKSEDQITFIVCTLENLNMNFSKDCIQKCFQLVSQDPTPLASIETCVMSKNDKLMEEFANKTAKAFKNGIEVLPSIILGNEPFNATLSNALEKSFLNVVCQKLANTTAGISVICSNGPPTTPAPTPANTSTTVSPEPHSTTPPGSAATANSVTYLPIVFAIIVLLNLKSH